MKEKYNRQMATIVEILMALIILYLCYLAGNEFSLFMQMIEDAGK